MLFRHVYSGSVLSRAKSVLNCGISARIGKDDSAAVVRGLYPTARVSYSSGSQIREKSEDLPL